MLTIAGEQSPKFKEERYLPFAMYILTRDQTLPRREREILMLRIGWLCRSEYEFGQHTRVENEPV